MKTFMLLSFLLIPALAKAIPEERLPQEWSEKALPYFKSMTSGTLTNPQGVKLKYFFHTNSSNHKNLVIVPGRSEAAIKYAELIYDLKDSGFNIFIMDHQGQGESDRLLLDSHKGHVVYFQNYVRDFEKFVKEIVTKDNSHPLYLIAHSMGGAISTHFMRANPKRIEKAVLVAPMFKLNTSPYQELVARLYSGVLVLSRQGQNYAPGRGPYVVANDTFERNEVTHSEARFNVSKALFVNDPNLIVGGPTARWVNQALKATQKIDRIRLNTPVLMLQAGQDKIVMLSRQNSFCANGPCEMVTYPDAYHEILMEKDSIRDLAMKEIKTFLEVP